VWRRPEDSKDEKDGPPFAVLDQARKIGGPDDWGPVVSLHRGEDAAMRASKSKKVRSPKIVQLDTHRQFRVGDHVGRGDIVLRKDPNWAARKANNDQTMLGYFQKLWGNK